MLLLLRKHDFGNTLTIIGSSTLRAENGIVLNEFISPILCRLTKNVEENESIYAVSRSKFVVVLELLFLEVCEVSHIISNGI